MPCFLAHYVVVRTVIEIIERQGVICYDVNRNNRVTGWLASILHKNGGGVDETF